MLIGSKANKTMAEYKEKLADFKNKAVRKQPDDVYLEVVGGRKKGEVYGLGSASSLFYKAPTSSQTTESTHAPSLISQLYSQVEDCKRMAAGSLKLAQATQESFEKEKVIWMKEKQEYRAQMDKMQQMLAEMGQMLKINFKSGFTSVPRRPRDPSGGGAPCPT